MKSIVFMVPKMQGPKKNGIYNTEWNKTLNGYIDKNKWRLVTPSVLLLASIAANEGFEPHICDEEFRHSDLNAIYDIVCF